MIALLVGASPLLALASELPNERTQSIVFVDVSVLPMNTDKIMEHQTMLVHGDRIERIGSVKRVRVPASATVIDGRGRYLMPGLTDFHVDFPDSAQGHGDEVNIPVSHGITTAVNMHGTPVQSQPAPLAPISCGKGSYSGRRVTGVVPGFSMQDELEDLVSAGLTPYQVLHAATAYAATFLGTTDHSGTVRDGEQADLL